VGAVIRRTSRPTRQPQFSSVATRYKTGAAFFHVRDTSHPERGDERPVVCVDLDSPGLALDGVALDAVFRFDLGKPTGTDSGLGGEQFVIFERGNLHIRRTDSLSGPPAAVVASFRGEHGPRLIESPTFLDGALLDVTVNGVDVFEGIGGQTLHQDLLIPAELAAFAYVAAYRRSGTAFSLSRDPLGALAHLAQRSRDQKLRAEIAGDGPGWWEAIYYPTTTVSETGFWEDDGAGGTLTRIFRLTGPSNPGDPFVDDASITCEAITKFTSFEDPVGQVQPIACKGL
jgi:hypothetical protein